MREGTNPSLKSEWITLSPEKRLHQCPIPIVGLTGGIATGKSTTAQLFQEKGLTVINADTLIKEIYTQKESFHFIQKEFQEAIANNKIDFKKLRQEAFAHKKNKEKLESFLYQRMPAKFRESLPPHLPVVIYDVPLLFEKELAPLVDVKILVYAPRDIQLKRLVKRDGISQTLAQKMLAEQWPIEEKKSQVDFVIDNSKTKEGLRQSFEGVFHKVFTVSAEEAME